MPPRSGWIITTSWNIIEKESVDEIIFRSAKVRNRLILELMARGGMRIGEVLKLTASDLQDRKLTLREPKSGREHEVVFIPQKVADRLRRYAAKRCQTSEDRIFPISYEDGTDDGSKGWENGRRSPAASRFAPVCRHLCIPLRRSHRNCQQSDPSAFKPINHPALPWEDHRHRGHEMD
jgi:integrase